MHANVRRKVVWGSRATAAVLAFGLAFAGCGDAVREGRGPAYLVLLSLEGANGATPEDFGANVPSDVLTIVKKGEIEVPTVFLDPGRVTLRVAMKDIGGPGSATAPSANNVITITRYRVVFLRADGRNTPGVDVPYSFDGAVTGVVAGASSQLGFTLVRVQAKEEAPLRALVGYGGAMHISTIAEVTFYGHDAVGNTVSVTGRISVDFADWGDPE